MTDETVEAASDDEIAGVNVMGNKAFCCPDMTRKLIARIAHEVAAREQAEAEADELLTAVNARNALLSTRMEDGETIHMADEIVELRAERDRYREALEEIADESNRWVRTAFDWKGKLMRVARKASRALQPTGDDDGGD